MANHGIFLPTCTGWMHPVHMLLIYMIRHLSLCNGGTFILFIDDTLALMNQYGRATLRELDEAGELHSPAALPINLDDERPASVFWQEQFLVDMETLGLQPTSEEELKKQGFSLERCRPVMYQSELHELTAHYYHIFGYEDRFGPWSSEYNTVYMKNNQRMQYIDTEDSFHSAHPYLAIGWALAEMQSGRSFVIDGEELLPTLNQVIEQGKGIENYIGHKDWTIPSHFIIPTIRHRLMSGEVRSVQASGCDLPVREALNAGATFQDILEYLIENVIRHEHREMWRTGEFPVPVSLVLTINPQAIIDDGDWARFVSTGQVCKPKKRKDKEVGDN